MLKKNTTNNAASLPTLPADLRIYAIGDIHGRLDLLDQLLDKIQGQAAKAPTHVKYIFLGDYIDRGFYSRQVIERLIERKQHKPDHHHMLMGNHEQVLRELLKNPDPGLLKNWLRFGGREAALSYGLDMATLSKEPDSVLKALAAAIPNEHLSFLDQLETQTAYGDYYFCHAGVKPGVPLTAQKASDLFWIRHEFLDHTESFGKIIVHGHTICKSVEKRPNRINIDTGAYATGCLTALGLEGSRRWLVQTNSTNK
jgi:serine/threonine protein phosphatase 1